MAGPSNIIKRRAEMEEILTKFSTWGDEFVIKDKDRSNKAFVTGAVRERLFVQQLEDVFQRCLAARYTPGKLYIPKAHCPHETTLNLNLSDLHYGAALDPRSVPHKYGYVEEARRTAAVVAWVASYIKDEKKRRSTRLVVNILGDVIQNMLHDHRDGNPLAEQFAEAVHLLAQALTYLAGQGFHSIQVNCTPGNHGRNTARHPDRATLQKWDSIENMIYEALRVALQHIPVIKFNIPKTPYFVYVAHGHSIFGTHGDTVINPGYPNKSINVANVRKQINEINAPLEKRHEVFVVGHVHVSSKTKVAPKVYFLSNGCLIPTDEFALSIGIVETACCQTIFESTPDHAVGFHCDIDVDHTTDRDAGLDKIITRYDPK